MPGLQVHTGLFDILILLEIGKVKKSPLARGGLTIGPSGDLVLNKDFL